MIFLKVVLEEYRKRKTAERKKRQCRAIAKAFNDRYAYREPYFTDGDFLHLTGTKEMTFRRNNYAWMCPTCNKIHRPKSWSVFSGLQYPACCKHAEGHRLDDGIKTK